MLIPNFLGHGLIIVLCVLTTSLTIALHITKSMETTTSFDLHVVFLLEELRFALAGPASYNKSEVHALVSVPPGVC